MRYPGVGEELLVCFALGERGLTKRERKSFDATDVLWLDVEEPRMLTMSKVFAWWRAASSAIHWLTHAVKVDDDTYGQRNESVAASPPPPHTPFTEAYSHARRCARAHVSVCAVHVPNLLRDLARASADTPHLCYAPLAHAGYNPSTFRMCGWSWQDSVRPWKARGCAARGMVPPFPFPLGAFQLLSRPLVQALGSSADVAAFASAANASGFQRTRESNEDVALGYWLWRLRQLHRFNISFVGINARATNLGCFRNGGLYQQPKSNAIVIHRIKGAAGMTYVWTRLHDGLPHDAIRCARDAEIELPKGAFVFDKRVQQQIREGEITLDFDQKTNMLSMRFNKRTQLPMQLQNSSASFFAEPSRPAG
jgi:hypothetical protein